jgi:hypothetical protein
MMFVRAQAVTACIFKEAMSRSTTALLLSALVFPGAGHLYLKRRGRALLFIMPTLVAAGYFITDAAQRAGAMADQIMAGTMTADPVAIAARLEQSGPTPFLLDLAMYVMLACWIGAAFDAWRLGRAPARLPGA